MMPSSELSLLIAFMVVIAAIVLLTLAYTLLRHRSRIGEEFAPPVRRWSRGTRHVEVVDPVARLRSPYKSVPLCDRCFAMRRAGQAPYFVCRLDERCGLLEGETADLS